jgi:hypothetical protein
VGATSTPSTRGLNGRRINSHFMSGSSRVVFKQSSMSIVNISTHNGLEKKFEVFIEEL